MKFIGTKTHAFFDYLIGILLITSPWIFDFHQNGIESFTPIFLGSALILYSLFTNYEWSINKSMALNLHLFIDAILGAVLALSPLMFGFGGQVFMPHLIIGLVIIVLAVCTKNTPYSEGRTTYNVQV